MNKRKRRKQKLVKKKPIISKEFKEMEAEVNINITKNSEKESITSNNEESLNEIDFFIGAIKSSKKETNIDDQPFPKGKGKGKAITNSDSEGETSPQVPVVVAASYVKIEDSIEPVQRIKSIKINFDSSLLFTPIVKEMCRLNNIQVKENNEIDLEENKLFVENMKMFKGSNMIRMVNRLYEQGNINMILSENFLRNQYNYIQDLSRYKTDYEKVFNPFPLKITLNSNVLEQSSIILRKKILTISIKELRFTKHPLQTEEHRVTQKLEDLFESYRQVSIQDGIHKITLELAAIREIITDLLEKSNNNFDIQVEMLQDYMNRAQTLRNSLHKEELLRKNLIKDILETWMILKNLRKKQGHNWTAFKLIIKTKEFNENDEEQKWRERFQLELNEILREEFSNYYKEKRQQRKHGKRVGRHSAPKKPNVEKIRTELHETLINCTRLPSDPNIELDMKLIPITRYLEKEREYYLKIFLDDELVETTKYFKLPADFVLRINKTFSIVLDKRAPENIKITIFKVHKISSDIKLADLYLPFSSEIISSSDNEETLEFISKNLKILGKLKVSLNCKEITEDDDGEGIPTVKRRNVEIPKKILSSQYRKQLTDSLDSDITKGETKKSLKKDKNKKKVETSSTTTTTSDYDDAIIDDDTFVFNEQKLLLCTEDEIDNIQRLKLLRLRYQNHMKYKNLRFIPIYDKEFEEETDTKVLDEGNWMDPIDLQKHQGKKYLRKLYETIQNHCIKLNRNDDNVSNLLIGNEPPTFSSIIATIMGFFSPARSLKSQQQSTAKIPLQPTKVSNFNIVVNIVRATNIPIRTFSTTASARRRSSGGSFTYHTIKYTNVNPFISVSYKDKILRTMTAEGSNPTWNEQLVLQVSDNITDLKDDIKFQLFDEYIEDLVNDDTTRAMEVYQRIHTNWLGELRLPISVIISKQRIEGVFELNSPKLIVGYSKPSLESTEGDETAIDDYPEIRDVVYLSLYIYVEPEFENPRINTSCLECSELKEVKTFIQEWCIQIKETVPQRFIDPLISLASGKRVCITRLLEPIPLPPSLAENSSEITEKYIRRFVSLISVYRIINPCTGLSGVWLNNQVILDTSWASSKDLGVLLTSYLLSLGIRAWLVLGFIFPYGESTIALIKEDNHYVFVDPFSGKKYSTRDIFCPVNEVYYIIGQENIYCNLQSENRVSMTDFNFDDSSIWMPLFEKINPAPIGGVHKLNYNYRPSLSIVDLRRNIERKIMKKINSWRSTRKTIWNRAFHDIMYNILSDLEQEMINGKDSEDYLERLIKAAPTYKLFGFTLNFGYTNLPSIADRIKSSGIHLNSDKNIEFSVAVHISQYPNNILSIWIFLLVVSPIL